MNKLTNNNIYWGYNQQNNTQQCKDLILSYIKFDIPIISANINKLCSEFNNLSDMIKVLYHISKLDISIDEKILQISKITNNSHKSLFNKNNSILILDKIKQLDNTIIKHIGGSSSNTNDDNDSSCNNISSCNSDGDGERSCNINDEKKEEDKKLCKDANITFTTKEVLFLKSLAIRWEPKQLIFQTLGSTLYISYIGDFIALCFSLIDGQDRMRSIILSLSLLLFGLGNAIKFGYLANDMNQVIQIIQPKLRNYNI